MTKKTTFIRLKLLSTFIVLCLVPTLLISYYNYNQIKKQIEFSTLNELEALAKIKSNQIERYFKQAKMEASTVATSPYVIETIINSKHKNPHAETLLKQYLNTFIQPREISEIYIFADNKNIIFSTLFEQHSVEFAIKLNQQNSDRTMISHIYKKVAHPKDYFFMIYTPVFDTQKKKIGSVATEFKANILFERIQDYTGLGATGETLLGKKIDKEVLFLNPLRHDPNAGMNRRVKIDTHIALPVKNAVRGFSGKGLSIDYRGEPVLAAWRYIPTVGWGIVAKIDEKEGFKPLYSYKISILLIAMIIIIFGFGASWIVAQNLMYPIKEMDEHAHIDPLTRLPNRRLLMDTLESILKVESNERKNIALLFLDIDGFKAVNDEYGHNIGDWLLQVVAQRIKNILRSEDMLARLGGDEFIVLVNGINSKKDIESIAKKIIEVLNEPFFREGYEIRIGTSIGIDFCNSDSYIPVDTLLQKADLAMYEAKKSGKNCFRFAL